MTLSFQVPNEKDALKVIETSMLSIGQSDKHLNIKAKDHEDSNISLDGIALADSIIKQKTTKRGIKPNNSIRTGIFKIPRSIKQDISMYDPNTNSDTLRNFFSVQIVKNNNNISFVNNYVL